MKQLLMQSWAILAGFNKFLPICSVMQLNLPIKVRYQSHVSSQKLDGICHRMHFQVKDTGIGIPEDKISRLFQSFSQVDSSTTRRYGGTGLGLAISKKLVEMMGGQIWAESELHKGSTFHFTILADATFIMPSRIMISEIQKDNDIGKDRNQFLRILLAEDNAVNQIVMQKMLNKLGYHADVAANGEEVLHSLELKPYDLILMDVQMPEMDGFEATRAIRKHWAFSRSAEDSRHYRSRTRR